MLKKLLSAVIAISVLLTSCAIEGSKSSSMSVSGDGSDHLLSEKEAVETLESLLLEKGRLMRFLDCWERLERTPAEGLEFFYDDSTYIQFDFRRFQIRDMAYAQSTGGRSPWEESNYEWKCMSDVEQAILDVFISVEDSGQLKLLKEQFFRERDGVLYYNAELGTPIGSLYWDTSDVQSPQLCYSPEKSTAATARFYWDLTTAEIIENSEDKIRLEADWYFAGETERLPLTMRKNENGKWVLTQDIWGGVTACRFSNIPGYELPEKLPEKIEYVDRSVGESFTLTRQRDITELIHLLGELTVYDQETAQKYFDPAFGDSVQLSLYERTEDETPYCIMTLEIFSIQLDGKQSPLLETENLWEIRNAIYFTLRTSDAALG